MDELKEKHAPSESSDQNSSESKSSGLSQKGSPQKNKRLNTENFFEEVPLDEEDYNSTSSQSSQGQEFVQEALLALIKNSPGNTSKSRNNSPNSSPKRESSFEGKKLPLTPLKLDFSDNKLSTSDAQELAYHMRMANVGDVSFKNNLINDNAAKSIGYTLQINQTLISLDLSDNQIGNAGARDIGDGLTKNNTLKVLNLFGNRFTNVGLSFIATALEKTQTLESLDIGDNSYDNIGVQYISEALQKNTSLKILKMAKNKIDYQGFEYFANTLCSNQTLEFLDLSENNIANYPGHDVADLIVKIIKNNHTLSTLDLSKNPPISPEGLAKIIDALKNHNITLIVLILPQHSDRIDTLLKRNQVLLKLSPHLSMLKDIVNSNYWKEAGRERSGGIGEISQILSRLNENSIDKNELIQIWEIAGRKEYWRHPDVQRLYNAIIAGNIEELQKIKIKACPDVSMITDKIAYLEGYDL